MDTTFAGLAAVGGAAIVVVTRERAATSALQVQRTTWSTTQGLPSPQASPGFLLTWLQPAALVQVSVVQGLASSPIFGISHMLTTLAFFAAVGRAGVTVITRGFVFASVKLAGAAGITRMQGSPSSHGPPVAVWLQYARIAAENQRCTDCCRHTARHRLCNQSPWQRSAVVQASPSSHSPLGATLQADVLSAGLQTAQTSPALPTPLLMQILSMAQNRRQSL